MTNVEWDAYRNTQPLAVCVFDKHWHNFVIVFLLQMYLPSEYLWGLINGDSSEGEDGDATDTEGSASLPPLMPPYGNAANASEDGD